jgi:hypothetical protein
VPVGAGTRYSRLYTMSGGRHTGSGRLIDASGTLRIGRRVLLFSNAGYVRPSSRQVGGFPFVTMYIM